MSGIALSIPKNIKALVPPAKKPNVIFILADDLGYSDLSCYGQKRFKTPNIDKLAEEGIRFTRHYSGSPVCAPSRCSLLTGLHTGHSYIRDNDEMKERGDVWSDPVKFEGQRPLPENTATIGRLLQNAGYKTAMIGKWGLGGPGTSGVPGRQGFDFFYGYLCQRMAHTYYPPYLWRNEEKEYLTENIFFKTHEILPSAKDENDPQSYLQYKGGQYSFDLMLDESVKFIEENKDNSFFLYFAPTIPHVALQVPDDSLAEFENAFEEKPYKGENGYLPQRKPRAAYAAMISRLDKGIGRIVALLEKLKLEEDTLLIFTSDNGATFNTGGYDPAFFKSNGELKGAKASLYEGGIRVPLIARWKGKISPGGVSEQVSAFWDFMPTLCEAAGIRGPEETDGNSILPSLYGNAAKQRQHEYLYWEHAKTRQAVLYGEWKGVRKSPSSNIELYNLKDDPYEKKDVGIEHPRIIEKLKSILKNARSESELFPLSSK
jgi:arylsulfatase